MSRRQVGETGLDPVRALALTLLVVAAGGLVAGLAFWMVGAVPPLTDPVRSAAGQISAVLDGETDGAGAPRVVVVGDGFTAGVPDADGERAPTWPSLVCREVGCQLTSYAAPGSGWTVGGSGGQSVAGSLEDIVAAEPDLVVIAVGSADVAAGRPRVRGSVNQVLYRLERRLPGVPVLVLSPFAATSPAPPDVAAVRSWVAEGATKHDATLVDVSDLLGAEPGDVDAGGRPTARGQEVVSAAVTPYVGAALASWSSP